ncbi:MAG: NAD-dependent epimerase/dehydratase family protein [Candidatus Aminicenantes bacterium]|nr:NAD-dependent epimerase/dehydratase family protein [Candidatus Aminicenantes bacterium]NIM82717.1 NAD-dependent epimerase/dehydratase family protein [Candidatus Aminicenantes bacterium]NIN22092.1 NAD-dependent epimerase/dehydratase family protein [Candidatus Aminicenantes bacterium]NIN45851.1 NAD-dependent epimerase/dehydratase family protein [Candidatus Aminicenantes bacterium]NIN88688.1 NAD-dependent epimerase/dehydratase family protein [Candidatus Aminicenantes bacterium]
MKRAFVTGASGFTGGYLCKALKKKGYAINALVRESSNKEELEKLGVEFIEGNLAEPESIKGKIKDVDIVFHIAALYRQEGVSKDLFTKVNVEGTRILLEESIAGGVKRFVHCSTVGVQGEIENPPATEEAPYNPGDHYQVSKLEGEKLALSYFREGKIDGVVVRPVGIYGPGDTRFLKLFRHIYKGNFKMIGKGEVLYHLTFVEDLVDGIILAGETPAASGQIYTIGGNEYLPLNKLVKLIAQVMEKPVSRIRIPLWPVYTAAFLCEIICRPFGIEPPIYRRRLDFFTKDRAFDISKAKKELNYNPKVPLKDGLIRTAQWYKENGWLE